MCGMRSGELSPEKVVDSYIIHGSQIQSGLRERESEKIWEKIFVERQKKRGFLFFFFGFFEREGGEREGKRQMADSSDSVSIDMETISLGGKVMHLRLKVGGCLVAEKMWAMGRIFFERQEFLVFWDRRKR